MHNIQYIAGGGASALLLAQLPRRSLSPPGYARLITLAGWRSAVSVRLTACYRCLLSQAQRSRSADLAVPAQGQGQATNDGSGAVLRGSAAFTGSVVACRNLCPLCMPLRGSAVAWRDFSPLCMPRGKPPLDLRLEWEPPLVQNTARRLLRPSTPCSPDALNLNGGGVLGAQVIVSQL